MSKKRNRQPDANPEHSEGSSESCDEFSTGGSCPHISKALNLSKIKKNVKKGGISTECIGCKKKDDSTANDTEEDKGIQVGVWICLQCGNQGCGRDHHGHAMEHFKKPFSDCHALVVHTLQWNVWCYQCEIEINSSCRKKLLETVMVVKKLASVPVHPVHVNSVQLQQSQSSPQQFLQNGNTEAQDSGNKSSPEFPKVGGLTNLGNTCFFNAVLQCLAQTPYLVKILEDLKDPGQTFVLPGGKHKPSNTADEIDLPPIEGTLEGWGQFTSILWKTLHEMQTMKQRRMLTPSELLNSFKKKTMQCMDGGQHDSHELLRHLLEIVRNEDLRRYQSVILKEVGLNGKTNPDGVENSLKSRVKFYGNQASARLLGPELVFRGVLVSTVECLDCHHVSMRTEPFLDLSLPVMAAKPQPRHFKIPVKKEHDSSTLITDNSSASGWLRRKNRMDEVDANMDGFDFNNFVEISLSISNSRQNQTTQTNGTALEVDLDESDADVEDNVEVESLLPEVAESGYSSEKASALTSPVSHHSSQASSKPTIITPNGFPESKLCDQPALPTTINTVSASDSTDYLTTCLSHTNISTEVNASADSPDNDALTHSGSLPTSLALQSDLTSPDWPPASLSSYPSPEKDTPSPSSACISPSCASPTGKIDNSPNNSDVCPSFNLPAPELPLCPSTVAIPLPPPDSMTFDCNPIKMENEIPQGNLSLDVEDDENSFEKKLRREEDETEKQLQNGGKAGDQKDTVQNLQTELVESPNDSRKARRKEGLLKEKANDIKNGTNSTLRTSEETHTHRSPTRYPTKEGECSVESCLNQFTALELMSGSNKVGCESCTERERKVNKDAKMVCTPSTKQYLISEVPPVLILHLKRCQAQRFDFRKVTKHVSYPMVLDLAPVCKGHKKSRVYALYGVVEHSGTIHGGHYVAYVKARHPLTADDPRWAFLPSKEAKDAEENREGGVSSTSSVLGSRSASDSEDEESNKPASVEPPSGKWYHVSDSRVSEVDERTVLQSQAYLLFYERIL